MKVFTIGFTQKTARRFFETLISNRIDLLIDVRLNNKSQLAGFAKDPDLEYFLDKIGGIAYVHDPMLAPSEQLLKSYRNREISWDQYESAFEAIMEDRDIDHYIRHTYEKDQQYSVCLLCSEPTAEKCHRRLIADHFALVFHSETIHL